MTRSPSTYYSAVAERYGECYRPDYGDRPGDDYPANRIRWELVRHRMKELHIATVLEAGCGEGTPLRLLREAGFSADGFDLEPEMVAQAVRNCPAAYVYRANATDADAYREGAYDAVCAMGPLPHLTDTQQAAALRGMARAVPQGGRCWVELRNELFAFWTLNRYSAALFNQLLPVGVPEVLRREVQQHFDLSQPPPVSAPTDDPYGGYGHVFSRFNNPLTVGPLFETAGWTVEAVHYYHYHAVPPKYERKYPDLFRKLSRALEWPAPQDWRGMFMASAFIVEGVKR